jgi:hypothetical protein
MPHGHAQLGEYTPRSVFYEQGRFGRLFPTLPVFAQDTPSVRDALSELGAKNGPLDAGDDLSDPISLITDPANLETCIVCGKSRLVNSRTADGPICPNCRPRPSKFGRDGKFGYSGAAIELRVLRYARRDSRV